MDIPASCVEMLEPISQDYCRHAPWTPSSVIQTLLQERFGVNVSISQVNRVRAALGISNHPESRLQEKKRQKRKYLPLKGSGRKGQGRSCFWLLLIRRMSSLS